MSIDENPWAHSGLVTALLLLFVVTILACGPADESVQRDLGNLPAIGGAPQESDPTPEPTSEPGNYPRLDELLQDIVRKYETGELTEAEAAALAPEHHGTTVLVQTDLPTNIDKVYTWLDGKQVTPLHKELALNPPVIYGFVPVSLLGDLSELTGVEKVYMPVYPFAPEERVTVPGPVPTRSDSAPPVFPPWLKGDVPSPGTYPKLKGFLGGFAGQYARGTLDLDNQSQGGAGCLWKGREIGVEITTALGTGASERVITWLQDQGVTGDKINSFDQPNSRRTVIGVRIDISLLAALGEHEDVVKVSHGTCPSPSSHVVEKGIQQVRELFGSTLSEGVAVHKADDWIGFHDGDNHKIGIIDVGFIGFSSSLVAGELPHVYTRCYESIDTTEPVENNLTACQWASDHGVNVAETVMDTAPEVDLYISNAAVTVNSDIARYRLRKATEWMKAQGVEVIVHAVGWDYTEGPGDGSVVWTDDDVHRTVRDATGYDDGYSGLVWVNAAGNDRTRSLKTSFDPEDLHAHQTYHEFTTDNRRMYIVNESGSYTVGNGTMDLRVYIRWDDSWGGANCDVDFYLGRYVPTNPVGQQYSIISKGQGASTQSGFADHKPYEEVSAPNAPAGHYYVLVRRYNCTQAGDLDYFQIIPGGTLKTDYYTSAENIVIPADTLSEGALAVGAAAWDNPDWVTNYSSRGPTLDGRTKPDVLGADCASTSRSPFTTPTGCGFPGTSQSAAHMGGLALLTRDRFPHLNAQQVAYYLKENTPNRSNADNVWGEGFVYLPRLVDNVPLIPLPAVLARNQAVDVTVFSTGQSGSITLRANGLDSEGAAYFNRCPTGEGGVSDTFGHTQGSVVTLVGCEPGTTQVHAFRNNQLLNIYNLEVSSLYVPPVPEGLQAESCGQKCLRVIWDRESGIEHYKLDYSLQGFDQWTEHSDTISPSSNTGYQMAQRGLECGLPYDVRISALGDGNQYADVWSDYPTNHATARTAPCNSSPTITNNNPTFTVPRTITPGHTVGQIQASDPDEDDSVTFSISYTDAGDLFIIGSRTGIISLNQSFSSTVRDSITATYNLEVTATDSQGASDRTDVTINVTLPFPPAPEQLRTTSNTYNSVSLAWQTVDNATKYRLEYLPSGSQWRTSSDELTDTTHTVSGLTCGEVEYGFRVSAYGDSTVLASQWGTVSPVLNASTGVCVHPVFSPATYQAEVPENAPLGTVLATVTATDPNGDPLTYELYGTNSDGPFSVDSQSGEVSLSGSLDRATTPSYTLQLRVSDPGGNSDTATLHVTVLEPQLPPAPAPASVRQSASTHDTITLSWDGMLHTARYQVEYRSNGSSTWTVRSTTGTDLTLTGLTCDTDYEARVASYGDGVTYHPDWGTPSGVISLASGVCPDPVIVGEPYAFTVPETAVNGQLVGTVRATDPTPGDVLSYVITGGNGAGKFAMESGTGAITVAGELDVDIQVTYALTVRVTDLAGYYDTTQVTITVSENLAPAPLNVVSVGEGRNWAFIRWEPVAGATKYRVEYLQLPDGPWITATDTETHTHHVVNPLVCEVEYEVRVTAYGDGTEYVAGWGVSSPPIGFTAADCGEPVFDSAEYEFSIRLDAAVGSEAGTVHATDPDEEDTVTYSLDSSQFEIGAASGVITLAEALTVVEDHTLTVTASDGAYSSTAGVTVTVIDTTTCSNGPAIADPVSNPGLVTDCETLLAARDTLAGTGSLNWSLNLDMTQWEGIAISGTPQRVTGLGLHRYTINGSVPAVLGQLDALQTLDLAFSVVRGEIPGELGRLSNLVTLNLGNTALSGNIPTQLRQLTALRTLRLNFAFLSGTVPTELGQLATLEVLDLSTNRLNGTVPAELADLTSLHTLYLAGNRFTGCVPASLRDVTTNDVASMGLPDC